MKLKAYWKKKLCQWLYLCSKLHRTWGRGTWFGSWLAAPGEGEVDLGGVLFLEGLRERGTKGEREPPSPAMPRPAFRLFPQLCWLAPMQINWGKHFHFKYCTIPCYNFFCSFQSICFLGTYVFGFLCIFRLWTIKLLLIYGFCATTYHPVHPYQKKHHNHPDGRTFCVIHIVSYSRSDVKCHTKFCMM